MASNFDKLLAAIITFATIQSAPAHGAPTVGKSPIAGKSPTFPPKPNIEAVIKKMSTSASIVEEKGWDSQSNLGKEKVFRTNFAIQKQCEKQILALGPAAIPSLLKALNEPEHGEAQCCAQLLTKLGPQIVRPTLVALSSHLERNFEYSQDLQYGAFAISELGDLANAPLLNGLTDSKDEVRIATMQVIKQTAGDTRQQQGYYGPVTPAEFIAPICTLLETDRNPLVRRAAGEALGQIGPRNQAVLAALSKAAISDGQPSVRISCVKALGQIGSLQSSTKASETSRQLESVLQRDQAGAVRAEAARAIGIVHADSRAVGALSKAFVDPDPLVQWAAASTLPAFGSSAIAAIPQAVECMDRIKDTEIRKLMLRINATHRFDRFSPGNLVIVANNPVLETARDKYQEQLRTITYVCEHFGSNGGPAVPMLIKMLEEDPDTWSRSLEMDALAKIGPAAAAAEKTLRKIAASEPSLRERCEETIKKITAPRF